MVTLRIPITQKIILVILDVLYMILTYLDKHMDLMYNPLWQFDILL